MSNKNIRIAKIAVDVDELRDTLMSGLANMADSMAMNTLYGRVLNEDGIAGVKRLSEIFFPEKDVSLAMKDPRAIVICARDVIIDAWSGLHPEREPALEKLLEVEKLLFQYRYECWFEQKIGGNIFDLF